jgi:predicted transcriptional regulator
MKKTSLYLDPETDRALDRLAKSQGISKAEAIRRALEEAVRRVERPRISAIGVGAGPGDVAGDVNRHLEQTGFGRA